MASKVRSLVALSIAGMLALSACSAGTATQVETVSPEEAQQLLVDDPDAVLLDIRTPEEFAGPRIEGATNIDFYAADFADQLRALDPDATYVVYCRSGNRSSQARGVFEELGFADVSDVRGGIVSWHEAGLPLEG